MLSMFAQSTLISYHTEAFVKTEVGCTVTFQDYFAKIDGRNKANISIVFLFFLVFASQRMQVRNERKEKYSHNAHVHKGLGNQNIFEKNEIILIWENLSLFPLVGFDYCL